MKLFLLTAAAVLASTQAAYYGSPTDYSVTENSEDLYSTTEYSGDSFDSYDEDSEDSFDEMMPEFMQLDNGRCRRDRDCNGSRVCRNRRCTSRGGRSRGRGGKGRGGRSCDRSNQCRRSEFCDRRGRGRRGTCRRRSGGRSGRREGGRCSSNSDCPRGQSCRRQGGGRRGSSRRCVFRMDFLEAMENAGVVLEDSADYYEDEY